MGNTIFIKDRIVCIKPLRSRLEAIQKLQPPTTAKGCRSFTGMINFLELQKLLTIIYDLTRKGRQFIWGKEQQIAFAEIKCRLIKPPVLYLPNSTGRFHLYSDTSKFTMGARIQYDHQNGYMCINVPQVKHAHQQMLYRQTCMSVCMCIHVWMYVQTHIYTYICMYSCIPDT